MAKKKAEVESNGVVESKADRFRRLINARLGKLDRMTRGVAALASKASYEYEDDQALKVIEVCDGFNARITAAFQTGKPNASETTNYV